MTRDEQGAIRAIVDALAPPPLPPAKTLDVQQVLRAVRG